MVGVMVGVRGRPSFRSSTMVTKAGRRTGGGGDWEEEGVGDGDGDGVGDGDGGFEEGVRVTGPEDDGSVDDVALPKKYVRVRGEAVCDPPPNPTAESESSPRWEGRGFGFGWEDEGSEKEEGE